MNNLLASLDTVASTLESRGLLKLASAVDTVANTVAAGPLMPGSGVATSDVVEELASDRHKLSVSAETAAAALERDPHLRKQCQHLADLMRQNPSGPWTTDVKNLVSALNSASSVDSSLKSLVESLRATTDTGALSVRASSDEASIDMLAIAMLLTHVNRPV